MTFTGTSMSLYLPQKQRLSFEVTDIIVDSLNTIYSFHVFFSATTGYYDTWATAPYLARLRSGEILYGSNSQIVGTYNTGEAFGFSGWIDTTSSGQLVDFNGIQVLDSLTSGSNFYATRFYLARSTNTGNLACNVKLDSESIVYNLTIPAYTAGGTVTGTLTTDTNCFIYGSDQMFYNSYENLLVPSGALVSFLGPLNPYQIVWTDGDSSFHDNAVEGVLAANMLEGQLPFEIDTKRSIPTGSVWTMTGYNTGLAFGNTFDGFWSGRNFVYEDLPSSITLNYQISKTDYLGAPVDKTVFWSVLSKNTPYTSYVTGFNLTSSGEYLYPPIAKFTGYYSVTGIQQSFQALLFSSGCTGNIKVSYSGLGGYGTGASGTLLTHAVSFQDIYTSGVNTFYIVDGYTMLSGGTGYTEAPKALFNTGQYGSTCYDVPAKYGYDVAWFRSSVTSGALQPMASFLTGVPLYTTGMVSGGTLTGYKVTGIEVWNIGSGYTPTFPPRVGFFRTSNDNLTGNLTGNASGTFSLRTGFINVTSGLTVEIRSGTNPWVTGTYLLGTLQNLSSQENSFSIRLTFTGAPNTSPWSGEVGIREQSTSNYAYDTIIFRHNFDTDPEALKKNDSVISGVNFSTSADLSFLLTQDELDTLYSDVAYMNNSQGFSLGDLDF